MYNVNMDSFGPWSTCSPTLIFLVSAPSGKEAWTRGTVMLDRTPPRDPSDYSPVWFVIPPQSIVGSPSWWSGKCASSPDQLSCPALWSTPVLCEFNFRKRIHYIQVFYRSKQIVSGICLCRGGVKCVAMWLWLLCNINGHFISAYTYIICHH